MYVQRCIHNPSNLDARVTRKLVVTRGGFISLPVPTSTRGYGCSQRVLPYTLEKGNKTHERWRLASLTRLPVFVPMLSSHVVQHVRDYLPERFEITRDPTSNERVPRRMYTFLCVCLFPRLTVVELWKKSR